MLILDHLNFFWINLCLWRAFFPLNLDYFSQIYLTRLWNNLPRMMSFYFSFMWFITNMICASLARMIERKTSHNISDWTVLHSFLGKRDVMTVYQHAPRKQTNFYASLKVSNTVDVQELLINLQRALNLQSALYIIAHHHCTHGNRLMIWRKWLPTSENNNWWKKGKPYSQNSWNYLFILSTLHFWNPFLFKF